MTSDKMGTVVNQQPRINLANGVSSVCPWLFYPAPCIASPLRLDPLRAAARHPPDLDNVMELTAASKVRKKVAEVSAFRAPPLDHRPLKSFSPQRGEIDVTQKKGTPTH
jgi:hypothetical protein